MQVRQIQPVQTSKQWSTVTPGEGLEARWGKKSKENEGEKKVRKMIRNLLFSFILHLALEL